MGGGTEYNDERSEALISGLQNTPSANITLGSKGGEYIGLITWFVNFSTFLLKPYINVHDVIILSEYRNMGIGRKMLNHLIDYSKKHNMCKLTLEVRNDNLNAQHLYRDLGFKEGDPPMFFWSLKL